MKQTFSENNFFIAGILIGGLVMKGLLACNRFGGDEWLVKVGRQTISVDAYQQRLRATHKDLGDIPMLDRQGMQMLRRRLLAEMISEQLLLAEADRRGIIISDQELAAELEALRLHTGEREWQSYLLEHYVDQRSWQAQLRRRLRIKRLLEQEVVEQNPVLDHEVLALARELTDTSEPLDSVELSQIVVADVKLAESLRQKILAGADFAELAREHSLGFEKSKGGYLGFMRLADLPQSFAPAFELKPGQLSEVVETEFGFHLFLVHSRRGNQVPVSETDLKQIRRALLQARSEEMRSKLVEKLKAKTTIELNQHAWAKLLNQE